MRYSRRSLSILELGSASLHLPTVRVRREQTAKGVSTLDAAGLPQATLRREDSFSQG